MTLSKKQWKFPTFIARTQFVPIFVLFDAEPYSCAYHTKYNITTMILKTVPKNVAEYISKKAPSLDPFDWWWISTSDGKIKLSIRLKASVALEEIKRDPPDMSWVDTLIVVEESSKDKNGKPSTIFYIREKPFHSGKSYQSTALSHDSAIWTIDQLKQDKNARNS